MIEYTSIFLYFFCYAFLGWACESIYVSFGRKKVINSGFLHIPICPIYGFGAMIVVYMLIPIEQYPALVFILGVLVTSVLEYFTSWLMEFFFHIRWWDYSKHKYNIHGRVCLKNSLLFGIMSLFAIYILQPLVESFVGIIPDNIQLYLSITLLVVVMADFVISTIKVINLNKSIEKIQSLLHEFSNNNKLLKSKIDMNTEKILAKIEKEQAKLRKSFPDIVHRHINLNPSFLEDIKKKIKDLTH